MAKILSVDDDPDLLTYLSTFFSDNGYETVTANDGDEGLVKIQEENPDLITLDIIMPNQTGVKMYRTMKNNDETKHIPVLIVSGVTRYQELFSRSHKTMPKPEGFIEKPVDRDQLLAKVKEIIG